MNINNLTSEIVIDNLKKLNYYNINKIELINNFIDNYIINKIISHKINCNKNIIYYINECKESEEFKSFNIFIDYKIKRSIELSNFIYKPNNFYDNCTNEELEYLGI